MNKDELKIVEIIKNKNIESQRDIKKATCFSLGKINKLVTQLKNKGIIDEKYKLTIKGENFCLEHRPERAIILAAGYGFRMIPINNQTNKAFIEVKGEILIERLIRQLKEAGVENITIVVGYKKERFDYLVDKFKIKLVINMEYAMTNSFYSLYCARNLIGNSYIVSCDLYFEDNPFSKVELYSWYLISSVKENNSFFQLNNLNRLNYVESNGNYMIGVGYISKEDKELVLETMQNLFLREKNVAYWEKVLMDSHKKIFVEPKLINHSMFMEFNTYKDFISFDMISSTIQSEVFDIIKDCLDAKQEDISNIIVLKSGMTNCSFLFMCKDKQYVIRIPNEINQTLINRQKEKEVYDKVNRLNICDEVLYFNEKNGYKLTKFIDEARICNIYDENDVQKCMKFLRDIHKLELKVHYTFDVFEKIEYYETLWNGNLSMYKDYKTTKKHIYELKKFIDSLDITYSLTHMDAVSDNFLLYKTDGIERIRLIDWEYASMQDPHLDIAMFAIYAMYNEDQINRLIDFYFDGKCDEETRIKIYCYIACCGLLWSNWCEYKSILGVEFGEYSIRQYRYAKDYYKIVQERLNKLGVKLC